MRPRFTGMLLTALLAGCVVLTSSLAGAVRHPAQRPTLVVIASASSPGPPNRPPRPPGRTLRARRTEFRRRSGSVRAQMRVNTSAFA